MKFEVICDTLCRKPGMLLGDRRFLKKRNVFYYKTEPYEVPFLLVLTKLSNFNGKIKKFKKIWLKFMKKGLKYRERRLWSFFQVKNLIIMTI